LGEGKGGDMDNEGGHHELRGDLLKKGRESCKVLGKFLMRKKGLGKNPNREQGEEKIYQE